MNEFAGQMMAEGWWCLTHEMFEDDDHVDTLAETCEGCGCNGSEHIRVQVVAK